MSAIRILTGDALETLRTLPDASVNCCVTSPPYFGLRDYGVAGQVGLEATPDEYVAKMVGIMREIRRVLKDDGVLFINIGDSYWSSGARQTGRNDANRETPGGRGGSFRGGVRRAIVCDTPGKEPEGSPENGCLCGSLCDACRAAYRLGISRSGSSPAPTPATSIGASIHEHTVSPCVHPPMSGSTLQPDHNLIATHDLAPTFGPAPEQPHGGPASTTQQSLQQHPGSCSTGGTPVVKCQLCERSLPHSDLEFGHKAGCNCDSVSPSLGDHNRDMGASGLAYPSHTTESLKPKDLIGIPWLLAFALRADGWYLRKDIIWHKPNPMPESVTDRPTSAHEYVFLMSKSPRYFYDADAIAEDALFFGGALNTAYAPDGQTPHSGAVHVSGKHGKADKQRGHGRRHDGFNDRWDAMSKEEQCSGKRNKRSVWTIATKPFSEAHFATMAPELAETCIKAGCPAGGTVIDPFGGAGTTALMADRLGRNAILIELNPAYVEIARKRLSDDAGMFAEVA